MEFNDGIYIPMESISFHDGSPIPIHVVTVDYDNQTSLDLQNMLNSFGYQVTKCEQGDEALVLLRTDKQKYSIVITSDHLPGNISGFDLLTTVSSELQLPIIMVSSDNRTETKLKANLHGCCEFIVKPVRSDSLKSIWEHVIRHEKKLKDFELNLQACVQNISNYNSNNYLDNIIIDSDIPKDIAVINKNNSTNDYLSGGVIEELVHEGGELERGLQIIERGIENVNGIFEDERTHMAKKPRLVWSENLHQDFLAAINQIGYKAVPKKILEIMRNMGYKNLSRENVASHLQKYRDSNKKCQNPPKTYSHGVDASQDQIYSRSNGIQNNSISQKYALDRDTNNRRNAQGVMISTNHGTLLQETMSSAIFMPKPNNNNYYNYNYNYNHNYNNVINDNPRVRQVIKVDQQQSFMSYQNSSHIHVENGKNDYDNNESLSTWRHTSFGNLTGDHGLTLDDLDCEFLISKLPHETSY